uniref:Histidine-rich glycoprotein n=1 Tax=Geotrypetes seraphini TaxID=260995 RepID=A0A6P8S6F9_GEOSA|nr:histidine-rich glycoprotein [Geotrypetes seraphini]
MKLYTALLSFTLFSLSGALTPESIVSANCSAVYPVAEKALDLLNKDREQGFSLSLFRVVDAHEQKATNWTVNYLIMDVVENKCPVAINKHWLECQITPYYSTASPGLVNRGVRAESSDLGTTDSVPAQLISSTCPDCPRLLEDDHLDNFFREKAEEGLETYNRENHFTNYFKFHTIEKVSKSAVGNQTYIVEFIVRETSCAKTLPNAKVSECHFLENKPAIGLCIADLLTSGIEMSCEIYDPKKEHPENPDVDLRDCSRGGDRCRHSHWHRKCHRHHHHHHHRHRQHHRQHHRHRHHHHHHRPPCKRCNHNLSEENEHQHEFRPSGHGYNSSRHQRPVSCEGHDLSKASCLTGAVVYVSLEDDFILPLPTIPDQPELLGPSDVPGKPGEELPPCKVPAIQPFPRKRSESESCPEQPREFLPEILHLFPK